MTKSIPSSLTACWDKIGTFAAIGIGFTIPISTFLTIVMMGLVLLAWLLGSHHLSKRNIFLNHSLVVWVYPFIFCTLMGTTYSLGSNDAIRSSLSDIMRLAFIPFLIYFYQSAKVAKLALWAFVSAMIITLILAFFKMYAGLPIGLKYTAGAVFKSYIKTSYFMAVSVFFLSLQLKKASPTYRYLYTCLIGLMIYYLLFMNVGRIGYICLVTFILLFAWQSFRLKGLLVASVIACTLIAGAYLTSNHFSQRVNILAHDMDLYHTGKLVESSLGSRLTFAQTSLALMAQHPLFGWGTGSFGEAYKQYYEGSQTLLTDNPHNEFLRTGVELGALGIGLLLLLFFQQWRLASRLPKSIAHFWQGVLLTFILGCFLNSWLTDATEGYFYCFMSAICFSYLPLRENQLAAKAVLN